jgi:hypothetical protein
MNLSGGSAQRKPARFPAPPKSGPTISSHSEVTVATVTHVCKKKTTGTVATATGRTDTGQFMPSNASDFAIGLYMQFVVGALRKKASLDAVAKDMGVSKPTVKEMEAAKPMRRDAKAVRIIVTRSFGGSYDAFDDAVRAWLKENNIADEGHSPESQEALEKARRRARPSDWVFQAARRYVPKGIPTVEAYGRFFEEMRLAGEHFDDFIIASRQPPDPGRGKVFLPRADAVREKSSSSTAKSRNPKDR